VVFSRQCESLVKKGDVVIGISTSGNSLNVKKGLLTSKKLSATTIGLLGKNGSIKKIVDIPLSVQCKTTPEIQEAHRIIYHIICEHVEKKLAELKNAEFVVHPECSCTTPMMYDIASGRYKNHQVQILSTEGMMNHVSKSDSQQFVVATETGILYRMRQQNPQKTFIPASENAECEYMKMITLDKVYRSLYDEKYEVKVAKKIADKARLAIERMLSIS